MTRKPEQTSEQSFREPLSQRIKRMNEVFDLPSMSFHTMEGDQRAVAFWKVLSDEVDELLDIPSVVITEKEKLVALADCLADIIVYCRSEALRFNIPIDDVLDIVMDSQDSKLVDGKAVMAEDGSKFIKGPNYEPPEDKIRALLG